jgi:TolB-like protein/class 3 adenylate cyclase/Flp pilus assembly protein TadD
MPDIPGSPKVSRRLAAILAADITGYSALMGADEARTVRDLKGHQTVVLPMIGEFGGRIIDTAGDGILAEFASVVNAVECAVAVQKTMAERNVTVEADRQMLFRIGINIGDLIHDDARVYGDGVNIAARLEGIAQPGGICISAKAHEEIRGKIQLAYEDIGEQQLKNISQPVRAYRVRVAAEPAEAPSEPRRHSLPDKPSIAVLPFTNIGADPDQDYLADGIVEDLITALSRFRWLLVIARNSSFTYKRRAVDVRQVARELGVRYILEGSVRKGGSRLRITGQLIDTSSGAHIWAERYDRDISDVFAIQDEITDKIVAALAPELTAAEIIRAQQKHPRDLDAWDAYLRALPLMRQHTQASNTAAMALLTKAIELSPDFSAAHARLSACLTQAAYYGWRGRAVECVAEALALARQSQALDPEEPLAFDALASAYQFLGDNEKAETAARRALDLSPTCTAAYGTLVSALAMLGRSGAALEVFARSERTSPRDPDRSSRLMGLASAYFIAERYDDAITATAEYNAVRPNWYGAYVVQAASYALTGRTSEAHVAAQRLLELVPQFTIGRARKRPMFAKSADAEKLFDGLQKAGVPT